MSELREVALAAEVCLRIEAARQYGFIVGGPAINVERCDHVLARAREHDITFSGEEIDAAIGGFMLAYNAEVGDG